MFGPNRFFCFLQLVATCFVGIEVSAQMVENPILTTAAQIRALSEKEASETIVVHLRGIYMGGADPEGIAFIMQDETDGIYVQAPAELLISIERGDLIEVEGVVNPGGFAPIVLAHSLQKIGLGKIPKPKQVTLDELYAGQMDAQWVEFSGVVRSVEPKVSTDTAPPPPGTRYKVPSQEEVSIPSSKVKMKLASGLARVMVELNGPMDPEEYVDAEIRLRGLCFNLHNRNRQYVKPFVQVPEGVEVQVLTGPAPSLFDSPPSSIANLLRFGQQNDNHGHRVHIQGVVVHHRPGVVMWVRDGGDCLRVESAQVLALQPGDIVDVLGFPVPGEYSPLLEDAIYRKRAFGEMPRPYVITDVSNALRNDANLVQMDAKLVELRRFPEGVELTFDWIGQTIRAHIFQEESDPIPSEWKVGSVIQVTGVCEVMTDEAGPLGGLWIPRSFELLLRSTDDVLIIKSPPWWNAERLAWLLLGFLLLALGMIAVTVWISKRRVQDQEHRRAMAETEFSAILNERNRVAREIHDTLSQGLGSISVQLELVRTYANELSPEIRKHLGTAHQLTREALREARNSIWNMRSHVLENNDLGDALSRILKQLTEGKGIDSDVGVEGTRRRLSPMIENNLLRIGQEAITNACNHAKPKNIKVRLNYEDRLVQLSIEDDGIGFDGNAEPPTMRQSFGLVGIRERADLIGGNVDLVSNPGMGCEITVSVKV